MSAIIYRTKKFKPHAKYDRYWNEYVQEGDEVIKYAFTEVKYPDRELKWQIYSHEKERWTIGDTQLGVFFFLHYLESEKGLINLTGFIIHDTINP